MDVLPENRRSKIFGLDRASLIDASRTSVTALAAVFVARMLRLPEFYWAPISAIVIIQSTIDPRQLSWQRFIGTAIGAVLGALTVTLVGANAAVYAVYATYAIYAVYAIGIFVCGVVCSLLRVPGAFRFAGITLSIVVLIARERPAWVIAGHRFIEVSVGIAVALLVNRLWPLTKSKA